MLTPCNVIITVDKNHQSNVTFSNCIKVVQINFYFRLKKPIVELANYCNNLVKYNGNVKG